MFKFVHALILVALMITGATIAEAQCAYHSVNPSLTVTPSAVAVDRGTTLMEQTYILDLDNQDFFEGTGCSCNFFSRQFCFRQETTSDFYAPGVPGRFITLSPPGFQCVTLHAPGCGSSHATIAVFVQADQGGVTPAHRYSYKTTVRTLPDGSTPILASATYYFNVHDEFANTCQGQVQP